MIHCSGYKSRVFLFLPVFLCLSSCSPGKQNDLRSRLLERDRSSLTGEQYSGNKELSEQLGAVFIQYGDPELEPQDWHVFTRTNRDNVLVLIQIKKLKGTEKQARLILAEMIEKNIKENRLYRDKKIYIAILGRLFWGALKTPVYESKSFPIKESELLKFYGPAPKPAIVTTN